MSDYFSLPPRAGGGSGTPSGTPGSTPTDDSTSEKSSQYFMDGVDPSLQGPVLDLSPHGSHQILPKDDVKSPYHVGVPVPSVMPVDTLAGATLGGTAEEIEGKYVREFPTDVLVDRFKKWRKILKGIANYLREVSYAQEQFARINIHLKSSVKFPFLTDIEEGTNRIIDPFDPKVVPKRQQPLTIAQQREQAQLQQQQELLQNWQQQQQHPYGPHYPQPHGPYRDFSDDRAIGTEDIQVVKSESESSAPSGFLKFGSGSVQDMQVVFKKYHLSIAAQQLKASKEINTTLLARIDDLRKDLHLKIKEIKELAGDFRTNINEHVAITGQLLNRYISSVKYMSTNVVDSDHIKLRKKGTQIKPKHDPYLLKLQLDLQIKRQLLEESYLQEAYVNLQTSGMQLEKIVYGKIQQILQKYSSLLDAEARLMIKNLCRELQQGILSKPQAFEWDKFVGHHPACLINWKSTDPTPTTRKLSDVVYPQMKSPMAKCIRAGYLSKKSKFLKNYNKSYFVLTSNYLHEFKSSNFFDANQQEDSKESQSTSLSATQAAKASLVPVMSISLNDCILTEASDNKFVLVGKPTYGDFEPTRLPAAAAKGSLSALNHELKHGVHHNPTTHLNEAPEKFSKHTKKTIGKLWKSTKPGGIGTGLNYPHDSPTPQKPDANEEQSSYLAMINQENNKLVNWSFRPSSNSSEEDIKQFRKWAYDLKNLTTFNNTNERSKFIEERIIKANYRRGAQALKHTNSTPNVMSVQDGSRGDLQSLTTNKPNHISLNNLDGMSADWANRSKCNTPAVDDNGNLITVGERRPNASVTSPLASPRYSVNSESSPSLTSGGSQQQFGSRFPPGMTITSKGISPSATVLNAAPVGPPPTNRSSSGPRSVTGMSPPSNPSGSGSVPSAHSEGSGSGSGGGGGYFAIPVSPNQEGSSQASTPSFVDAPTGPMPGQPTAASVPQPPMSPYNLPRSSSYTSLSRQYPAEFQGTQPSAVQQSLNVSSPLPKVRLNDQELDNVPSPQSDFQMPPPAIQPPPSLRRNASSGDIPTVKSDTSAMMTNPLYQNRANASQTSLTPGSPRTHALRKHKKNVSFSSLNSLVFSKKGANPSTNQSTDQFISGGIREDEDDDDPNTIKLHRSLYS